MLFTISIKICFFLLLWPAEKGTYFKFQWNFSKRRGKLILKHYFLLHLMCYIAPQWFIWTTLNLCFRIYFYIAPRRSQNITISIRFTFVTTLWFDERKYHPYLILSDIKTLLSDSQHEVTASFTKPLLIPKLEQQTCRAR